MRQNLHNRRGQRGAAERQWRSNLASTLADDLGRAVEELGGQVVAGWALLVEDIAHTSFDLRAKQPRRALLDSASVPAHEAHEDATEVECDPVEVALRSAARCNGMISAPAGFSARVMSQLPATPPQVQPDAAFSPANAYGALKQHIRLVCGAVSFSAIVSFLTTWLLATVLPSFAFALLATLVTLGLVLVDVLRTVVQVTAGAASNPVLVLAAMSGPLIVFLLACTQLARLTRTPGRSVTLGLP